jgi:flagellar basal-body rod protein FlgF
MLRGLYTAAAGSATLRARMDVLTNNIVNAETIGYKKDSLISSSFESVLIERINDPYVVNQSREVGPYSFGTHIDEVSTDYTQGNMESTGKQTDLAISGEGFFAIGTPEGEIYSRSGAFSVDSQGYLVNGDGYFVLGEDGPLNVGFGDFAVDSNGVVTADGEEKGIVRIVDFQEATVLRKQGDNLYYSYGGETPAEAENAKIMQGFQESSNVDIASEMVDMMTVYRAYEANQKILTMTDETLGLAVNNLGRLR